MRDLDVYSSPWNNNSAWSISGCFITASKKYTRRRNLQNQSPQSGLPNFKHRTVEVEAVEEIDDKILDK
jgi:hypothetical protein